MLQQISEQVVFNYVIELVPDNNYGAKNTTTQEWNGLVRGKIQMISFAVLQYFTMLDFL